MVIFPLNMVIFPLNMVIFHCYVSLPEGNKLELPDFFLEMWKVIDKKTIEMMERKRIIQEQIDEFFRNICKETMGISPENEMWPQNQN
jgi:hypothetical protein